MEWEFSVELGGVPGISLESSFSSIHPKHSMNIVDVFQVAGLFSSIPGISSI